MPLTDSQKGKVVETLIAAHLILGSEGDLNVSVPLVDDDGVDLVLNLKGKPKHMLLQVKSRFTLSKKSAYRSHVRRASFNPRDDLYLLFAFFDTDKSELGEHLWLIPSLTFEKLTGSQSKTRKFVVFSSTFKSKDMWAPYRMSKADLPENIIDVLSRW